MPARIDAEPLEDVSAITFLGERLVAEHPGVKTWMVGSPAEIPFDTMPTAAGPVSPGRRPARESFYPMVQGYKDTAAVGVRLNFSDPLQLNRLAISAPLSPVTDLPASERLHVDARVRALRLARARLAEPRRLLRSVRPDEDRPQGLRRAGRPQERTLDLRRAAPARSRYQRHASPATSIACRSIQNVPVDVDRAVRRFDGALAYTDVRNSLGYVDDETGAVVARSSRGRWPTATWFRRCMATYDRGVGAAARPLVDLAADRGRVFAARSRQPVRQLLLRRLRQQLRRSRDEKRYRAVRAFPAPSSTRSAAATS